MGVWAEVLPPVAGTSFEEAASRMERTLKYLADTNFGDVFGPPSHEKKALTVEIGEFLKRRLERTTYGGVG